MAVGDLDSLNGAAWTAADHGGSHDPRPYRLPRQYLPVPLDPPGVSLIAGQEPTPDMLAGKGLAQAIGEAEEFLAELGTYPLAPAEIADRCRRLRRRVLRLRSQLQPHLDELTRALDDDTSVAVMTAAGIAGSELELLGNVLQDRYFQIVRVGGFDRRALAAQCCASADAVLLDLPHAVLGIEEYSAIIRAIAVMWATLEERGVPAGSARPVPVVRPWGDEEAWASWWRNRGDWEGRAAAVAQYRWTAGHHLLDLCFVFGRGYLAEATTALRAEDWDAAADALRYAAIFLRGSTAGMRYASNFPARIYNELTRPSMDVMGEPLPMGFSGTQNVDYVTFQQAKHQLTATVKELRPLLRTPALRSVYRQLREFREVYLADMEQHVLIAAAKVGTDTSLMQKASQRELPEELRVAEKSGTDVLRDLANIRRREVDW
jgi:hypothetical protein